MKLLCTHSVIHQQIFYNEVGHNRLHGWGKLIWSQHGYMTQRDERCDQLLRDVSVQTTRQWLRGTRWNGNSETSSLICGGLMRQKIHSPSTLVNRNACTTTRLTIPFKWTRSACLTFEMFQARKSHLFSNKSFCFKSTSNIWASWTSLLWKIAWMQCTACLAWCGVPLLAFWWSMGIRVLRIDEGNVT